MAEQASDRGAKRRPACCARRLPPFAARGAPQAGDPTLKRGLKSACSPPPPPPDHCLLLSRLHSSVLHAVARAIEKAGDWEPPAASHLSTRAHAAGHGPLCPRRAPPQLAAGAPLGPPRGRLCAGPCSPAPSCPPQVPREVASPPRRWPQAGRRGALPALCRLRWRLSASRSPPPRTLQACSPLLPTPSHGAGAQGPAVTRGPVCRVCVAARG